MAKKRKRRRMSLLTKAINWGVLLFAFGRPIQLLLAGGPNVARDLAFEASGGLATGASFNKDAVLRFYGPMVAAIVLKKAISMVRRTARV